MQSGCPMATACPTTTKGGLAASGERWTTP
jgi:hypothetical protein